MCIPISTGGVQRKRLGCVGELRAHGAHPPRLPSEGFPEPGSGGEVVPGPSEEQRGWRKHPHGGFAIGES